VTRAVLALAAAIVLAGCATRPAVPPSGSTADLRDLEHWTASGRLALAAGGEGGSGTFTWEQQSATTRLELRGPFGTGALQVVVTPESISVADGAGRAMDAEAARSELRARIGADLPWGSLRYWMLGVPAPDAPAEVSEAQTAPLRLIEQSGWSVGYDAFTVVGGASLPRRLTATGRGVRVRVLVDRWTLSPEGHGRP
jgi:outer membrane lipoprotein LolB